MIKKIEFIIKHNLMLQRAYKCVFSTFFRLLGLIIKQDNKKVFLQSLIGRNYGDSPKVLFDRMKDDPFFADYNYVWAFDDPEKYDVVGANKVRLNSLQYFIESLKAAIWITNVDIERGLNYKSKEKVYLNTFHGGPIKIGGNAQPNRNDYDYSDVDFMCSFSEFDDQVFIRDFKVRKEALIRCGMPRNDILFHITPEMVKITKEKYGIPLNKKVLFYAPTWRDSGDGGQSFVIAPPIHIDYWRKILSDNYVVLFRMHHLSTKQIGLEFDDFVRDYSGNYNINDLMIMADVLISDYSGTVFDFLSTEKPIALFAYDYEDYKKARGLYLNLEEFIPGNVFYDEESLLDFIVNMDYQAECCKSHQVKKTYMDIDGNATEICMNCLKESIINRYKQ